MVKIKICGITNLSDALTSINAGCHALGFIFYKKSPRYISAQRAKQIIRNLPKKIKKIGVFVNAKEKIIKDIARICKLDLLQFHGDESPRFCQQFKDYPVIKAFRIKDRIDLSEILSYNTSAYLFDTFVKSKSGGTGKHFNWDLLKAIRDKIRKPIFLSGGLDLRNVKEAIKLIRPDWVDVSSSLEIKPGKKDPHKIIRFIKAVKAIKI
ncbi:MAG: phosphoribosylanthranilate isomerase [Candidatus Omnitrophica bacterium]|nr:phosphoribosylanthranilate isomerase [Candidatus Omnitrophota bacterium]